MASATLNTTRQVGGVFGIALLGSIVTGRFLSEVRIALNAMDLPPFITEQIVEIAQQGRGAGGSGMTSVPGVDVNAIQQAVRISFTNGMHHALWFAGGIVLAGAVVAAIMIRGTAPHEQMARNEAAQAAVAGAADPAQGLSESSATV